MRTKFPIRRLNFRHLHYFWVVAKEGHLTRAASELNVSQSALSSQIRLLEEQLGHALFEREGRRLVLTETGRVVLGYAESVFSLADELVATLRAGDSAPARQLRIGAVATLSRNFQDNFLRPVLDDPALHLVIESAGLEELLERLRVHKLDLILANRPVAGDAANPVRCRRLARQHVCLVGPPRKRRRAFRFPEQLAELRLLLPGPSSDIRTQFDLLCQSLGVEVQPWAEVDDMAMLRLLARDSGGAAVVPEVVVQDELRSGLLQKYCEIPGVFEEFHAITAPRQFQPEALRRLLAAQS